MMSLKTVYFSVKLPSGGFQSLQKYAGKSLILYIQPAKADLLLNSRGFRNFYDEYKGSRLADFSLSIDQFCNQEFEDNGETMEFCGKFLVKILLKKG